MRIRFAFSNLMFFLGVFLAVSLSNAKDIELTGTMSYKIVTPPGGGFDFKFSVLLTEQGALIRTSNSVSHLVGETAFDQDRIFRMDSFNVQSNGRTVPVLDGWVEYGDVPAERPSGVSYLWLAFASGKYFEKVTNNFIKPIWVLDDPQLLKEGFTVKSDFTLAAQRPYLPTHIVYWNDGNYRVGPTSANSKRMVYAAPPPFNVGYTNAIYESLSSTNFEGWEIPIEFKFTRYFISGDKLAIRTEAIGKVESLLPSPKIQKLRPSFIGEAFIHDFRFSRSIPPVNIVRYHARDGNWPEIEDLQKEYKAGLVSADLVSRRK